MAKRPADKPWQLIIWILGTGFMFFGSIGLLFTEGFDWGYLGFGALNGYGMLSCLLALRKSLRH